MDLSEDITVKEVKKLVKLRLRANEIVDRIGEIAEAGEWNQPVALARVGVESTVEALSALFLVTAQEVQVATLNPTSEKLEMLKKFIDAANSTALWISSSFSPEGTANFQVASDAEQKINISYEGDRRAWKWETIGSFLKFLAKINPSSEDYWLNVYLHIALQGVELPPDEPFTEEDIHL